MFNQNKFHLSQILIANQMPRIQIYAWFFKLLILKRNIVAIHNKLRKGSSGIVNKSDS